MNNKQLMIDSINKAKRELNVATTYELNRPGDIAEALQKAQYHISNAFEEMNKELARGENR